ncbi:carbohydrate ABC transporter permease [Halothermothrix orenii]|uniref:Binding-protein-dependent transport systems inner membrane component n=1 Tax=Halothermothrix orenii (strain H 168 / OCM 544 / DSM 9562) TaxID=373903 RepID=B8CYD5_HALOH|nr:sugar ABC transporter permease [Halothermothrix orenii]ACL70304.1 binding-protein-dependent transport systems inner membrane component [Halothermothrix orenii H 168]
MNRNNKATIATFLLPAGILLLLFMIIPFFMAFGLSFTNQRLIPGPRGTQFIGLYNYSKLFSDRLFWTGLKNNFIFVLIVVPLQTAFALGLALLVNMKLKLSKFFRTMYFVPTVTTMIVVSVIWSFLYHPEGLINGFLSFVSGGSLESIDFLRETRWAFPSIMFMSIWQGVGFQMLIFLAGLQEIPESLYEAAEIDGANSFKRFLYITLPQLKNTTIFVIISTTILAFRLFTQVFVMTNGGPRNSTYTVMLHIYNMAFKRLNIGYGSALTVIFFSIILIISLIQKFVLGEEREVG